MKRQGKPKNASLQIDNFMGVVKIEMKMKKKKEMTQPKMIKIARNFLKTTAHDVSNDIARECTLKSIGPLLGRTSKPGLKCMPTNRFIFQHVRC